VGVHAGAVNQGTKSMSMTDELERLSKLHREGSISDAEFERAKAKVLAEEEEPEEVRYPAEHSLGEAANRYVSFRIVMTIIGGIAFLIFFFGFFLPRLKSAGFP
jgi:hypothetical protein